MKSRLAVRVGEKVQTLHERATLRFVLQNKEINEWCTHVIYIYAVMVFVSYIDCYGECISYVNYYLIYIYTQYIYIYCHDTHTHTHMYICINQTYGLYVLCIGCYGT